MIIKEEISKVFAELIHDYKFTISIIDENQDSFISRIENDKLIITFETYHREIYAYVASTKYPETESAIVNVINFISKNEQNIQMVYYHEITDLSEAYHLQLVNINKIIQNNMQVILDYYETGNIIDKHKELGDYIISKNPELFKTVK
jgi:hypothetical protein